MRRALIVGNWKMHGLKSRNIELLGAILQRWQGVHQAEVAVCAPFVYLAQLADSLTGSNIALGAQDVSAHPQGAYTGDISSDMLADLDCHYAIVGHSERRQYQAETDSIVAQKFARALSSKLIPILCVGEHFEERERGETMEVVSRQLKVVIDKVGREAFSHAVIAYEPIWAIGTGCTAEPGQAQEVHEWIRAQLGAVGESVRILYGGSVKASTAKALFAQPDIDGALVGGASLKAEEFIGICQAAE